jgi:lysophospholipase L1-like esterase
MTDADPTLSPSRPLCRRRWRRALLAAALVILALLVAGELVARYHLGLGDPPLSMDDPDMKYRFLPNQDGWRCGNHYHYNQWSMRCDDFPLHKTDPRELRVLMIGDSVINGGALTDQNNLASHLLQERLAADLHRPTLVGNISAGSWQPVSEYMYLKRFGLFDADVLVVVVNSADYSEILPPYPPTAGIRPDMPAHKPWCALSDGFFRYFLPRISGGSAEPIGPPPAAGDLEARQIAWSQACLRDMIQLGRRAGCPVIVAQYLDRDEATTGRLQPGYAVNRQTALEAGATLVNLGPAFTAAAMQGMAPYRDFIHPNAYGQDLMARALLPVIESALAPPAATRP